MSTDADSPSSPEAQDFLAPYAALPGVLKSRKLPLQPKSPTIGWEADAEATMDKIASAERVSRIAAAFILIKRYPIATRQFTMDLLRPGGPRRPYTAGNFIVGQLLAYVKNVSYAEITPVLSLPTPLTFPSLPIYRSRLPLHAIQRICQQIDSSRVVHGDNSFARDHVFCRSRYLNAFFIAILDVFGGSIRDEPPRVFENQFRPAGIEHHFKAFGATVLLVMVKLQTGGPKRDDIIARLLAECEAWDFHNHQSGKWVPLIGVLCDATNLQFFLYDSSERKFSASEPMAHFPPGHDERECLKAIRIIAETLHDLFLLCLINGLRFYVPHIEPNIMDAVLPGTKARFRSSVPAAESALEKARRAAKLAEAVKATDPIAKLHDAEKVAEEGYEELKRCVGLAPAYFNVWRYMDQWRDEHMLRC